MAAKQNPNVLIQSAKAILGAAVGLGMSVAFVYAFVLSFREFGIFGFMPPLVIWEFFVVLWMALVAVVTFLGHLF